MTVVASRETLYDDPYEDDWWAALMVTTVTGGDTWSMLERFTTARPTWQKQAACRGRTDLSWFDHGTIPAVLAVCAACPVQAACYDYGQHEPAGVWGGEPRGLRPYRAGGQTTTAA